MRQSYLKNAALLTGSDVRSEDHTDENHTPRISAYAE